MTTGLAALRRRAWRLPPGSLAADAGHRVHGRRSERWRIGAAGVSLSPIVGSGEER